MPNHITNRLTIKGDAETIAEVRAACFRLEKREAPEFLSKQSEEGRQDAEQARQRIAEIEAQSPYEVFDFNQIIPVPAFIAKGNGLVSGSREDSTGRNWYEWNKRAWGTKWNSYDLHMMTDTAQELVFTFDTAWNEPQPVIETLVAWFPELHFFHEFVCEGGWFCGHRTYSKKEVKEFVSRDSRCPDARPLWKRIELELRGVDIDADDDEEQEQPA